jgi:hypothetical protein
MGNLSWDSGRAVPSPTSGQLLTGEEFRRLAAMGLPGDTTRSRLQSLNPAV